MPCGSPAGGALALAGCREPRQHHPRRLEKFHRADRPRRTAGAADRSAHRAARRPPLRSRRHFSVPAGAARRPAGSLSRVHRHGADGHPQGASRERSRRRLPDAFATPTATAFDLEVGPPLGFNNTFAIVVRGEDAGACISARFPTWCPTRRNGARVSATSSWSGPDGYRGWAKAYGLSFARAAAHHGSGPALSRLAGKAGGRGRRQFHRRADRRARHGRPRGRSPLFPALSGRDRGARGHLRAAPGAARRAGCARRKNLRRRHAADELCRWTASIATSPRSSAIFAPRISSEICPRSGARFSHGVVGRSGARPLPAANCLCYIRASGRAAGRLPWK